VTLQHQPQGSARNKTKKCESRQPVPEAHEIRCFPNKEEEVQAKPSR